MISRKSISLGSRTITSLILCATFVFSLAFVDWSDLTPHGGGATMLEVMLREIISLALSSEFIKVSLRASFITLSYALCSISLAIIFGLIGGILASGGLFSGFLAKVLGISLFRVLLAILRSIHELIWAWLIAVSLGFSPISGVIALAIPYGAILARVYADFLNDVPQAPLSALRSSGASSFQTMLYGRLPQAAREMFSYGFYRFECCVRSASVLSFIGLQGLGYQIGVSLDDLKFGEVWTLLAFLIGLIVLIDYWGSLLRRSLS